MSAEALTMPDVVPLRSVEPRTKRMHAEVRTGFMGYKGTRYSLEMPEEVVDVRPIVLVNGYGGKKFAYNGLGKALAEEGKPAITINLMGQKGLGDVMMHAQDNFANIVDIDMEDFDALGHSMGGQTVINQAVKTPDLFNKIVLFQSAGVERHNTFRLVPRIPSFVIEEMIPAIMSGDLQNNTEKGPLGALRSEIHYFASNPIRALMDGLNVSNANIHPQIRKAVAEHGIGVIAMMGSRDTLLPSGPAIEDSQDMFDELGIRSITLDGGHLLPQRKPRDVAKAVINLLNDQEQDQHQPPTAA